MSGENESDEVETNMSEITAAPSTLEEGDEKDDDGGASPDDSKSDNDEKKIDEDDENNDDLLDVPLGVQSSAKKDGPLALSVLIANISSPDMKNLKKDTNLRMTVKILTNRIAWTKEATFKEVEIFHSELVINDNYRGVALPKLPYRISFLPEKGKEKDPADDDEYLLARKIAGIIEKKKDEYRQYFLKILRRILLLGSKQVADFFQFPASIRVEAEKIAQAASVPLMANYMKKEGERFKAFRNRYFVLLPNHLLQYFESSEAYKIGVSPKGSVDLTECKGLLVYESKKFKDAFGIKTPKRSWKFNANSDGQKKSWISAIKNLLESKETGYIPELRGITVATSLALNSKISSQQTRAKKKLTIERGDDEWQDSRQRAQTASNKIAQILEAAAAQNEVEMLKQQLNSEHKIQLEQQQIQMRDFKKQIETIANEMQALEEKRAQVDREYTEKIASLTSDNEKLQGLLDEERTTNNAKMVLKDAILDELNEDVEKYKKRVNTLEREFKNPRGGRTIGIEDVLAKYVGDSKPSLKFRKTPSKKTVMFLSDSKRLVWFDEGGGSSKDADKLTGGKGMIVQGITVSDRHIGDAMVGENRWFLVEGKKRIALFETDSVAMRDRWHEVISHALRVKERGQRKMEELDEKKGNEKVAQPWGPSRVT